MMRRVGICLNALGLSMAISSVALGETSTVAKGNEPKDLKGEVLEQSDYGVVINLGEAQGMKNGQRIEFFREEEWLIKGTTREEQLAVGVIGAVTKDKSIVLLGPNERVPVGSAARPTEQQPTADPTAPPRLENIWELRAALRPYLGIETAGGGVHGDAMLTYRFSAPVVIHAGLLPFGFGAGSAADTQWDIAPALLVGLDHQLFEVGVGLGLIVGNATPAAPSADEAALTINQLGRIGSTDGIHLLIRNSFYLRGSKFRHGYTDAELLVPVNENLALLARGGGSDREFGFGEVGMRIRLKGNGDKGSIFLAPVIGGAGFRDYSGPMVGLGLDYRF